MVPKIYRDLSALGFLTRDGYKSLKATSHSTIFDIPMRLLREDQKHLHRFTR